MRRARHPWGCAPGTSYSHFGMRYQPPGGCISIYDPAKDNGCADGEVAGYDAGRDLVLLPRKKGRVLGVPAVEFWGRYEGDFWDARGKLLLGRSSGRGRDRVRSGYGSGEDWREGGYGVDKWVDGGE